MGVRVPPCAQKTVEPEACLPAITVYVQGGLEQAEAGYLLRMQWVAEPGQ